jgi:hypothetical protein
MQFSFVIFRREAGLRAERLASGATKTAQGQVSQAVWSGSDNNKDSRFFACIRGQFLIRVHPRKSAVGSCG